jgi:uncharacterized protein
VNEGEPTFQAYSPLATLALSKATPADGGQYAVIISNTNSAGTGNSTTSVGVAFSLPLDPATATNTASFKLSAGTISTIAYLTNSPGVVLQVSGARALTAPPIWERMRQQCGRAQDRRQPSCPQPYVMFSLQRLLGKEDRFFDLLEASAAEACASVRALSSFIQKRDELRTLDEFIQSRRKEKKIVSQISEELCTSFVTALEREDIEALSVALYKIPKTIEKIGERIVVAPHYVNGVELNRQLRLLETAVDTVLIMIKELRRGVNLDLIRTHNDALQTVEGEADKVMLDLLADLYSGKHDPVRVIFLKDLFELFEKATDRCRDAGNVINHIVLKNS